MPASHSKTRILKVRGLVGGHCEFDIELEATAAPGQAFSAEATSRSARLVSLVPNGVLSWSLAVPGIVESSNNPGTVRATDEGARLMSTITAAVTSRKHEILDGVSAPAALAGGNVSQCRLELGMFSQRVPVLDIISIGTELHDLHSPRETVKHTSVNKVWPLIRELMGRLG